MTDRNDSGNRREPTEDVRKNIFDRLKQMGQRGHVNSSIIHPVAKRQGLIKVLPFVFTAFSKRNRVLQ